MEKVDIIAFGAHPDDVEIGTGGLVAKEAALGYKVGIVDLTQGEMSTNGTIEERSFEAQKAAEVLGAKWRLNLAIPDRKILINDENLAKVVRVIRQYQPEMILIPHWEDRHPDHVDCSELITVAHFNAGLRKFLPELEAYRPPKVYYYLINSTANPSFVVDVSDYYELKKQSIFTHESQFLRTNKMLKTVLNNGFPYLVESRDRYFGAQMGVKFAEGFITKKQVSVNDPMK
jgi:N-acetylglucosamine malate deacetylase 1